MSLTKRQRYLQVAFNRDLDHITEVLSNLPDSDRILVEAGTPLIKRYGGKAVEEIRGLCGNYLVADVKAMDRGAREVEIGCSAGADAVTVLGCSPVETLDSFIGACRRRGVDSMVDMMNVTHPVDVLSKLRERPDVIILHRGFDEHKNRAKELPLLEISEIRKKYGTLISVAGGVDLRDAQKAVFNGANIVVLGDTLTPPHELPQIAKEFLETVN